MGSMTRRGLLALRSSAWPRSSRRGRGAASRPVDQGGDRGVQPRPHPALLAGPGRAVHQADRRQGGSAGDRLELHRSAGQHHDPEQPAARRAQSQLVLELRQGRAPLLGRTRPSRPRRGTTSSRPSRAAAPTATSSTGSRSWPARAPSSTTATCSPAPEVAAPPRTWDELGPGRAQGAGAGRRRRSATRCRSGPRRRRPSGRSGCGTTAATGSPATRGRSTATRTSRRSSSWPTLANTHKVTQVNPGKTNRTDGAFQLFKDGKVGMVMGFSPLAAPARRREGKVQLRRDPDADQCRQAGDPRRRGLPDGLQEEGQPGSGAGSSSTSTTSRSNITRWITAEGFLPVTKSGRERMSGNAKLKPYLDALPSARLAPTTDPMWDRVKLDVQQSIGAGRPAGRRPEAGPRPAPEERRAESASLTGLPPARGRGPAGAGWRALLWLGPSLAPHRGGGGLPGGRAGPRVPRPLLDHRALPGPVGPRNYARLLEQDALPTVVGNTVVWVAVVVGLTLVLSLGLAQLLNKRFSGPAARALGADRAVGRLADHDLEALRVDLRLLLRPAQPRPASRRRPSAPVDWLGDDRTVMGAMIAVGVFVSLPFTTYVLLAGLPDHSRRGLRGGPGGRRVGLARAIGRSPCRCSGPRCWWPRC